MGITNIIGVDWTLVSAVGGIDKSIITDIGGGEVPQIRCTPIATFTGRDALAACSKSSPIRISGDGPSVGTSTVIYADSTCATLSSPAFLYDPDTLSVYYWDGRNNNFFSNC